MTTSASTEHSAVQPRLTADQALQRLIDLLRDSKSINDFTPEFIGKGMGVDIKVVDADTYGFGEKLDADWGWGIQRQNVASLGPRVDFGFSAKPGTEPAATAICGIDAARFGSELESIGFTRTPAYAARGRIAHFNFDRDSLHVEVLPQAEFPQNRSDGENRACVKTVLIR
ncbi:hypothetical protein [Dyella sp. GSA-30]|uniref:hypothetical protein n=1 Tax=Dyella sp. GSA-30 TaxID=2994496 RepID=UPI002490C4C0|nr:hypothetical protein [Dyella sp. GSA-30]BDU21717.1 hypothetical protein DYGSA30_31740 [Dyella sp. GSA-30]